MRPLFVILAVVAPAAVVRAAPDAKYPYETLVEKEETYVRSGPSTKFYPTAKLRRGDKVVVHRLDPGGWLMIAPPAGSFSWVPAKHVEMAATDRGTIKVNRVAARVGSFESDIREVFQRPLAEGDEVRILGEKMLAPESGSGPAELWYRIEPPRGEWRWIAGQDVAPLARGGDDARLGDPFESTADSDRGKRSSAPAANVEAGSPAFDKPIPHAAHREYLDDSAGASNGEPLQMRPLVRKENHRDAASSRNRNHEAILDELDRLDARFRSILIKAVREWDFGQLENDYQTLRGESDSDNIQQMIDTRLHRIADYRSARSEEEERERIQAEATRRDAELSEIQRRQEAQLASLRQPRFDGAGIVERSALTRRGAPRYVLLAPTGRVLAYLAPAAGVNLEAWIGRAAGVNGSRLPHPELKSDLITVNRLTPVRLVP